MTPLARPTPAAVQILRLPAGVPMHGPVPSMIYQLEAEHQFPLKIGVRAVGWIEEEVREWLTQRVDHSRGRRSVPLETRTYSA